MGGDYDTGSEKEVEKSKSQRSEGGERKAAAGVSVFRQRQSFAPDQAENRCFGSSGGGVSGEAGLRAGPFLPSPLSTFGPLTFDFSAGLLCGVLGRSYRARYDCGAIKPSAMHWAGMGPHRWCWDSRGTRGSGGKPVFRFFRGGVSGKAGLRAGLSSLLHLRHSDL